MMNDDYLWTVIKPRGGGTEAVEEMNAKWLVYAPDTPARHDNPLFQYARAVVEDQNPMSIAHLFRSIIRT